MNIMHLKYVVEVEKTSSINQAAKNLLMGQPNLSRAIRELEESLGITIFKRTSKGIITTPRGQEFLGYAKGILSQIEEIEAMYQHNRQEKQCFSVSIPRAGYISHGFMEFVKKADQDKKMEFYMKETNSMRAINNILQADYNLGIIRYQTTFESYFDTLLYEKGLKSKPIWSFRYVLIMSEHHPLASEDEISQDDLKEYIELTYGDPYVPSMPVADVNQSEFADLSDRRIFIFERGSQMDLLSGAHHTYLWGTPMHDFQLKRHNLVQKECVIHGRKYKDVLIYKKDYHLSDLDNLFLQEIQHSIEALPIKYANT